MVRWADSLDAVVGRFAGAPARGGLPARPAGDGRAQERLAVGRSGWRRNTRWGARLPQPHALERRCRARRPAGLWGGAPGRRRQTSPTAGTIFASTHVPLRLWFRAMSHLTQSKQGISNVELGRRLGVTQTTAWKIKHKLAQVMRERDATKPLSERVEFDDA